MKKIKEIFITAAFMMILQGCGILNTDDVYLNASNLTIDEIRYKVSKDEATIVSFGEPQYKESMFSYQKPYLVDRTMKNRDNSMAIIPSVITYKNGKTYRVTGIGQGAFSYCVNLRSVVLPEGMTTIGEEAFQNCKNLNSITIPSTLTSVGKGAFRGCEKLMVLTLSSPEKLKELDILSHFSAVIIAAPCSTIADRAFANSKTLASVLFPNTLTHIGNHAFENCTGFASINIPHGVRTIGTGAFSGCENLKSVVIPSTIENIGKGAFNGCVDLRSVTIHNPVPIAVDPTVFYQLFRPYCTLYVPAASVALYKEADVWKDFKVMAIPTSAE
jgi:hypothetical protein